MARKKSPRKRKAPKSLYLWFFLLLLLLSSLTATFYFIFLRPGTVQMRTQSTSSAPEEKPLATDAEPLHKKHIIAAVPYKTKAAKGSEAKLAIIIDDMGHTSRVAMELLALDLNLSFAFLPFGQHTSEHLQLARQKNRDILLHLPMQAQDSKWDPGAGALYTEMGETEIIKIIDRDLAAVPGAIGVNNHMGSLFTENTDGMRTCLTKLRQHNLFFVDSLTSSKSIAFRLATEMGLESAKRDIFLDNDRDKGAISNQVEKLIRLARKRGSAIGIGHPHRETLNVLRKFQKQLQTEVRLVGVSKLVH